MVDLQIFGFLFFFISCKSFAIISHACFVVNKTSNQGGCASDCDSIKEKIAEKVSPDGEISDKPSYEVLVTTGSSSTANQALNYYKQWLEKQEKEDSELLMVAVGGDGTVSDVVQELFGLERVSFGILPCGTGNDTARTLGIPVGDMSKAVNILLDGNLKNMGSYLITGPCYGKPDTMGSRVAIEEFDLGVTAEAGAIKRLHDRNENTARACL